MSLCALQNRMELCTGFIIVKFYDMYEVLNRCVFKLVLNLYIYIYIYIYIYMYIYIYIYIYFYPWFSPLNIKAGSFSSDKIII